MVLHTYAFVKTSFERERHLEGVRTSLTPSERRFLSKRSTYPEYVCILVHVHAPRRTFFAFQPTNPPKTLETSMCKAFQRGGLTLFNPPPTHLQSTTLLIRNSSDP